MKDCFTCSPGPLSCHCGWHEWLQDKPGLEPQDGEKRICSRCLKKQVYECGLVWDWRDIP